VQPEGRGRRPGREGWSCVSCRVTDSVLLLGGPRRRGSDRDHDIAPGLASLLAAYLAVREAAVPRDEAVAPLWPEEDPKRGRHNVSQLL